MADEPEVTKNATAAASAAAAAAVAAVEAAKMAASTGTAVAVLSTNVEFIKQEITTIKTLLENKYVTKEGFEPVRRIVYGLVGAFLLAIVGAIIQIVIK